MGACSSCLGRQQAQEQPEPSENSRLLDDESYHARYGATPQRPISSPPQPDPEQLRREREALDRICASASNKLIDVTHSAHAEQPVPSMQMHYARLFRDAFAPSSRPAEPASTIAGYPFHAAASGSPTTADDGDAQGDADAVAEQERQRAAAARAWLRDVVDDVSTGKKWDPASVRRIAGRLTFSFDDFAVDP